MPPFVNDKELVKQAVDDMQSRSFMMESHRFFGFSAQCFSIIIKKNHKVIYLKIPFDNLGRKTGIVTEFILYFVSHLLQSPPNSCFIK